MYYWIRAINLQYFPSFIRKGGRKKTTEKEKKRNEEVQAINRTANFSAKGQFCEYLGEPTFSEAGIRA